MDDKIKQVKTLFKELTGKKIKSFDILKGGYSNEVYLFNDAYVMKLPKDYIQPFIDYENEEKILYILKEIKEVEKCLFYDFNKGLKISKFIHGAKSYLDDIQDYQIVLVAKFLKKLHKNFDDEIKPFNAIERLKTYREFSHKESRLDGRYERKIINQVNKILEKGDLRICHNDLVKGNLLFKYDKLRVVDWEFSGLNSIYFDLASFISENNLNQNQIDLFLKTYFGSTLNQSKLKKVNQFIEFEDLLWHYWALMMKQNSDLEIFDIIAKEKLDHIKQNMNRVHELEKD